LHQAVEAKEHVKVEAATQTFATITLAELFSECIIN
jgi:preprotein translocase subunit SecA